MDSQSSNFSVPRIVLSDVIILTLVYFIPAVTHLLPFPLYILDPMRILLLIGFLISRNNTNSFILALTIPLISTIATGHPPFFKAILIAIELFSNLWLFVYLNKKVNLRAYLLLPITIILSKIIYYTLKFIFIKVSLIDGALITTDLLVQAATVLIVTIVFGLTYKKLNPDLK